MKSVYQFYKKVNYKSRMTPAFLYKDIDFASNKKRFNMNRYFINGVHEGIRTPDRTLRRRVLYPAELRRHLSFVRLL